MPLDHPAGAIAHARVDAVVETSTGHPVGGVEVTVREARLPGPYRFTSDTTGADGGAFVVIWRLGGPALAGPDTVSFYVVASARRRGAERAERDSVALVVRFAPERKAAPRNHVRITVPRG